MKDKVTKKCPTCNDIFIVLWARRQRKYCSVKCSNIGLKTVKHWWHPKSEFKKGHKHSKESILKMSISSTGLPGLKGKKNPMWKGVKYKRYIHKCGSKRYKKWRKSVFKKDDYSCQECWQYGKDLQAHHVLHWATNKKERFKVTNGVTLCKRCHKYVHWVERINKKIYEKTRNKKSTKG